MSARRAVVGLALLALGGCKSEFTGPYPCETGYDSCISPEQNWCETDITGDAAHCGACGHACALGALCVNSSCLTGAQNLTGAQTLTSIQNGQAPKIAVNGTGLYWVSSSQNQIMTMPISGGAQTVAADNINSCGTSPFALTNNSLFYVSNNVPCPSGGCTTSGLVSSSIPGGAITLLVQNDQSSSIGCPSALAHDATRVYWMDNQNSSVTIRSVPLAGGTVATLGSAGGGSPNGNLVVTQTLVLFDSSNNGPTELRSFPVTGSTKPPNTISPQLNGQGSGFNTFVADDSYLYVASGGCPCNNDNNSNGVLPSGSINRFALDGSGGINLAQFPGIVNSMQLDSGNVYFATDAAVWKVPKAGGSAQKVADNLAGGASPTLCSGGCGFPMVPATTSIAVDAQSVYIADVASNVNAILKVKK